LQWNGLIGGESAALHARDKRTEKSTAHVSELKDGIASHHDAQSSAESVELLLALQKIMFRYDVSMLKSEDRLTQALNDVTTIKDRMKKAKAPHTHEFVRLNETDCMIDTAEMI
jgi:succinate dehydrogenase/fumarate reductase flavoprotein subunit